MFIHPGEPNVNENEQKLNVIRLVLKVILEFKWIEMMFPWHIAYEYSDESAVSANRNHFCE